MTHNNSSPDRSLLWHNVVATLKLNWQIDRGAFVGYVSGALVQVVSSVLSIFFASRIVGELTLAVRNLPVHYHRLYLFLILNITALIAERLAWRWLNFCERRAWISWFVRISLDFNQAVANLDMPQHHDNQFQKTLNKLTQRYQYVPQNFSNIILQLFHSVMRLASSLIIVLGFAPWLVPILLISLLPNFITERRLSRLQWTLWDDRGDESRLAWRLTYYLQDKHRLQETKLFQTQAFLLHKLQGLYDKFYGQQIKNINKIRLPASISLVIEGLAVAGVELWLLLRVVNHSLSLANFTFYTGIISQFSSSLGLIVNSFAFLTDENEYMKDLFKLFRTKPILEVAETPVVLPPDRVPRIEFRNVSFRYDKDSPWALKDVSFTLSPGDKVAFVGENGAGKTTIVLLLLRFYDVTEGEILVDNVNIKQLDKTSYYHHLGVLFQNFNDYPLSVRDNIAIGRVDRFTDDDAVRRAADEADATKFIAHYPNGLKQILEIGFEGGIEPSGGQWQRIGLARALFRNAGILVLDEPTAAVDAKSEAAIFKTLEKHSAHKTTIVISHRFSTVRTANKIYVIEAGKLIEQGSHAELMQNASGLYRAMFETQAQGYR